MNMVDYVLIAFVLLGAVAGYRRGMMVSLVVFLGWLFAGTAAYLFSPRAVTWMEGYMDLTTAVAGFLRERLPVDSLIAPAAFSPGISDFGRLNRYIQDIWVRTPADSGGLADVISQQVASILVHSLAFAALLVVFLVILQLMARFLSRRLQGTLLGFFNRLGGMVLGGGVNMVAAAFVVGIAAPWLAVGSGTSGLIDVLSKALSESTVAPYFVGFFSWMTALLSGVLPYFSLPN